MTAWWLHPNNVPPSSQQRPPPRRRGGPIPPNTNAAAARAIVDAGADPYPARRLADLVVNELEHAVPVRADRAVADERGLVDFAVLERSVVAFTAAVAVVEAGAQALTDAAVGVARRADRQVEERDECPRRRISGAWAGSKRMGGWRRAAASEWPPESGVGPPDQAPRTRATLGRVTGPGGRRRVAVESARWGREGARHGGRPPDRT